MSIPPRILYVDDEPDNLEMMRYWLREDCGLDVTTALDGESAMEHIRKEFFDIYLLDYCLPDTTGVELCKRIRRFDKQAPILIYSALDRDVDRQRSLDAGANMYLVKPDELEKIRPQLERLLHRRMTDNEVKESKIAPSTKTKSLTETSPAPIRARRKHSGIM
jgi:DNA-binding response OmpR family regulator